MKIVNRLLDYSAKWELPDVYLFTGNSTVKNNGALVMGRGAAKQVRDSYPGIDKRFGTMLQARKDIKSNLPDPSLLWVDIHIYKYIGWFKVKEYWGNSAQLDLIETSMQALNKLSHIYKQYTYHMNFPGIGNGKLKEADVMPILEQLPDNVLIYR